MKIATLLLATLLATPALAGTAVTLKAEMVDADGVVTLGEIFDGAGAAGRTPIASRTGASVMLNAAVVQAAGRRAGLDWANAEGLRQIIVRSGAITSPAALATRTNVDVLTWTRNIAAGDVVQPQDMVWAKVAVSPADAATDPDAVVGLAARRTLRAGAAVAGRDVAAPQVVKANEIVTLTFDEGGITLTLQAKALSGGGVGETISAQNVTSRKTIQAVVSGPGQALVGPAADKFKLTRSTRYALR